MTERTDHVVLMMMSGGILFLIGLKIDIMIIWFQNKTKGCYHHYRYNILSTLLYIYIGIIKRIIFYSNTFQSNPSVNVFLHLIKKFL
jgi:hypothetical protein